MKKLILLTICFCLITTICQADSIAFRSASSFNNGSTDAPVIAVPAGVQDGDVMILFIYANQANDTIVDHVAWTLVRTFLPVDTFTCTTKVYYRIADSEPANYTWDLSDGTTRCTVAIIAFIDVDNNSPINVEDGQINDLSGNEAPSIDPTVPDTMLLFGSIMDVADSFTYTPPAGMIEAVDTNTSAGLHFAYESYASENATGTRTATTTGGVHTNSSFLMSLNPAEAPAEPSEARRLMFF